jgi:hypothetical protein
MSGFARSPLAAILGPTNTGKTHLAVERMCAHSSGMIGFPLRLLAREVYDRVVKLKGPGQVALITGEEKILPRDARWFLCTGRIDAARPRLRLRCASTRRSSAPTSSAATSLPTGCFTRAAGRRR